ncbi:hypothetical protein N177_3279 [Lutibaculum baratangense AMV1]|uniref:HTH tetR-type domain-containing protein n=1 Tax=Lutibaculum baratangense AMV1 TaxID=631454 RepID=V4RAK5_9HYPH|nr:hypothetical protein N177_3279 [Lutibaculum baratangense AMV1]
MTVMEDQSPKDRLLDAALGLAARRPWEDVSLADIAHEAHVSLGELHAAFRDKLDILVALSDRTDQQVLDTIDTEMSGEPPRERLFDVMMARFDALRPHRAAVRSIANALARSPADLIRLRDAGMRSMTWTLEAAGMDTGGQIGALRAQGLAVVFARTLRVWLEDDDPGMAKTMVALDRRLREGERAMGFAEGLSRMFGRFGDIGRRGRYSRDRYDPRTPLDPEQEGSGSGI